MNKFVRRFVSGLLCIALLFCLETTFAGATQWENPFSDVDASMWSYSFIKDMNEHGVVPSADKLAPYENESRGGFVSYLYALHRSLSGQFDCVERAVFEDVPYDHEAYDAIIWAKSIGIVNGVGERVFAPDAQITREHICTIISRYVGYAAIKLPALHEAKQFVDSLRISDYARSPVIVCQMAGIVNGYDNGYFRPGNNITRQECIAMVWRVWKSAKTPIASGTQLVSTHTGAYDSLYDHFLPVFDPVVSQGEPVDLSYFDNVAFVGDSVSLMLQYYCASTRALGNATFLCAGSLSASNALHPVTDASVHPSYQGKKGTVEDCVAASGDKIVYIMLGINNISFGIDRATADLITLVERITEKTPDVKIVMQSVTPMARSSSIISEKLNNERISAYNNTVKTICEERGWYYINVSEVVADADGYLVDEYCGDPDSMGIHFNSTSAAAWVEYLKTHVPAALMVNKGE